MEYSGHAAALVVAQDITERKRAEEERQKFFTLVEYSRDFIAVADLQDNVEYVNPAGRAMLGIASFGSSERDALPRLRGSGTICPWCMARFCRRSTRPGTGKGNCGFAIARPASPCPWISWDSR